MAGKESGLGARVFVDGYDLSGDFVALNRMNASRGTSEATGVDKEAFERLQMHRDGGFEIKTAFNKDAGASFPVLKNPAATDRHVAYLHRATIGASAITCQGKQFSFDWSRPEDGTLFGTINIESNAYGVERGTTLTAGMRTDTGATNGAAVDFAAATSFGLQAWLQVNEFTGTDVTVKLQEDDNSGFSSAADVTGGGFTQITGGAPLKERIQTTRALAVERYLRVVTVTTGGFSSLSFCVIVRKNTVSTLFGP
jgi:hypothetical protein